MKVLNTELFVIVPISCLRDPDVELALEAVTREVGGVTITEVRGQWIDDDGQMHYDRASRYSWFLTAHNIHLLLWPVIVAMKAAGEKAVMWGRNPTVACIE